jgi:2-hydroxychromene-2-carboxylate isomerase
MQTIDFYFDFLSPFSFFAWINLKKLKQEFPNVTISYHPVILGQLLNHHGIKGPGEVDSKREYLFKSCLRYAKRENIKLLCPKFHPFNPLYALRLATIECSGPNQEKVIDTIWYAGWSEGLDIGSEEVLEKVLNSQGFNAKELIEKSYQKDVKQALKSNTQNAININAFGVPTLVVNGKELFWGNDSLTDLKNYLNEKDDLDLELYQQILRKTQRNAAQSIQF